MTVTVTVLLFWMYFFLLTLVFFLQWFPLLGNSDHVVVSVFVDFPSNSKWDTPFHRIAYDYSCTDWEGLRDQLRDAVWKDIFKLSSSAAASEFCDWGQVGIHAYIPHRKNQAKHHSPTWFSAACVAAIVHRNHFFCLYQQNDSSESKVKFRRAIIPTKRFLKLPNLHLLIKQKNPSLPKILMTRVFLYPFYLLELI